MLFILSRKPAVKTALLSDLLTDFRKKIESESGQPLSDLNVNAALFLRDLCTHLGFKNSLCTRVVGVESSERVEAYLDSRVELIR